MNGDSDSEGSRLFLDRIPRVARKSFSLVVKKAFDKEDTKKMQVIGHHYYMVISDSKVPPPRNRASLASSSPRDEQLIYQSELSPSLTDAEHTARAKAQFETFVKDYQKKATLSGYRSVVQSRSDSPHQR